MITLRNALEALKEALPNLDNWQGYPYERGEDGAVLGIGFPVRLGGICLNVSNYMVINKASKEEIISAESQLEDLIGEFCRWRGDPYSPYPVGGAKEFYGEINSDTMWDNPLRLALLDWLLEHCQ